MGLLKETERGNPLETTPSGSCLPSIKSTLPEAVVKDHMVKIATTTS